MRYVEWCHNSNSIGGKLKLFYNISGSNIKIFFCINQISPSLHHISTSSYLLLSFHFKWKFLTHNNGFSWGNTAVVKSYIKYLNLIKILIPQHDQRGNSTQSTIQLVSKDCFITSLKITPVSYTHLTLPTKA